ncbi:uncharacterized protein DDB_G0292186-like [Planococcus citri]|uniref:uncharacterized protein DDB_G0292186-like n=1 Tax=Planococcus citri TaxID=170843 RepID=UPI0031F9C4D4
MTTCPWDPDYNNNDINSNFNNPGNNNNRSSSSSNNNNNNNKNNNYRKFPCSYQKVNMWMHENERLQRAAGNTNNGGGRGGSSSSSRGNSSSSSGGPTMWVTEFPPTKHNTPSGPETSVFNTPAYKTTSHQTVGFNPSPYNPSTFNNSAQSNPKSGTSYRVDYKPNFGAAMNNNPSTSSRNVYSSSYKVCDETVSSTVFHK